MSKWPDKNNYNILLQNNYTIKELKDIAIHNKIKLTGANVKADIINRIYTYFSHYDKAKLLQKTWRNYLFRVYNKLHGPARFNRKLCVNETDFFTMDNVNDIPYNQFYSFTDVDDMVYGFDIVSIYNLFEKNYIDTATNPYNRNPFPKKVKKNMLKLLRLSRIFKETINVFMNAVEDVVENVMDNSNNAIIVSAESTEHRIIALFHDIDILGNYTNYNWFLNLNQSQIIRFIVDLNDIFNYRANIGEDIKRDICPSYRDLFRIITAVNLNELSVQSLYDHSLTIMEKLVRTGINHDNRTLGTNFVLCALTIISTDAAIALPWLYQSVV